MKVSRKTGALIEVEVEESGYLCEWYYFSSMSEVLEVRSSPSALIELSVQKLGDYLWIIGL